MQQLEMGRTMKGDLGRKTMNLPDRIWLGNRAKCSKGIGMYQGVTGISGESHSEDGFWKSGIIIGMYQATISMSIRLGWMTGSFCASKVELDQDLQGWFAILPRYSPMYLYAIWRCRWLPSTGSVAQSPCWRGDSVMMVLWKSSDLDLSQILLTQDNLLLEAPHYQIILLLVETGN